MGKPENDKLSVFEKLNSDDFELIYVLSENIVVSTHFRSFCQI
jgi:hypothetical protein